MQRRSTNTWRIKIVTFASFLFALPASAQGLGGVDFQSFHADVTVNADASFDVVETITGEYLEPRHGIFRNIPVEYWKEGGQTQSIVVGVQQVTQNDLAATYEAYREGPYETIKIGDADATISGPFTYEIHYQVARALLYHDETDELYWNVTGDQWADPFETVSATVYVPGVEKEAFSVSCYTGMAGSTDANCASLTDAGRADITAEDFLTISVSFPKGVVRAPTQEELAQWWLADNWDFLFIPLPLFVAFGLYVFWRRHGRDEPGRGTIVPEYDPPDDLRPTEIGTLMDTNLEPKDFSAAVVDLAVRGYLHITDEEKKTLLVFTSHEYRVRREKPDDGSLRPFEVEVLGAFGEVGEEVRVQDREVQLGKARQAIVKLLNADLAERGYYTKNPSTVRGAYFVIAFVIGFLGPMFAGPFIEMTGRPLLTLIIILCAVCVGIAGWFMPHRTENGTIAWERAMGFKMFLEKAEKYRIQWQEREGVFEKFLPYAMVFGVADKWSNVFEGIIQQSPSWYTGNMAAFNAVSFSNNMQSFVNTTSQVAAPKSSGGSGGGGSSGGGFGGGGGGSW